MIDDPDAFNPSFKPMINEVSCQIVQEKRKARDLTLIESLNVWKQIKEDKKKLRQIAKQIQEGAECTFKPDLGKKKGNSCFGRRSHSTEVSFISQEQNTNGQGFLLRQTAFQIEREKRMEHLQTQFYEQCSFVPRIQGTRSWSRAKRSPSPMSTTMKYLAAKQLVESNLK